MEWTIAPHGAWTATPLVSQRRRISIFVHSLTLSPLIADDIGPLILLIFAGCLAVAVVYVFFMIPETRRLTLEEVDEMYRSGTPAWRTDNWRPALREHLPVDDKEAVHHEHARAAAVLAR